MQRVATCGVPAAKVQALIGKERSARRDIMTCGFKDHTELMAAIRSGEHFDLFICDDPALVSRAPADNPTDERYFIVSTRECDIKVAVSSIICVETSGRALLFHLIDGTVLRSKTIRTNFKTALASLVEDERFIPLRKTCIINMTHVEGIAGRSFILERGVEIVVPNYSYTEAKGRYFAYLAKEGISSTKGSMTPVSL